jgi:hypothetical protein
MGQTLRLLSLLCQEILLGKKKKVGSTLCMTEQGRSANFKGLLGNFTTKFSL